MAVPVPVLALLLVLLVPMLPVLVSLSLAGEPSRRDLLSLRLARPRWCPEAAEHDEKARSRLPALVARSAERPAQPLPRLRGYGC